MRSSFPKKAGGDCSTVQSCLRRTTPQVRRPQFQGAQRFWHVHLLCPMKQSRLVDSSRVTGYRGAVKDCCIIRGRHASLFRHWSDAHLWSGLFCGMARSVRDVRLRGGGIGHSGSLDGAIESSKLQRRTKATLGDETAFVDRTKLRPSPPSTTLQYFKGLAHTSHDDDLVLTYQHLSRA